MRVLLPRGEDAAVELPERPGRAAPASRGSSRTGRSRTLPTRSLGGRPERPFAAPRDVPFAGSWLFAGMGEAAAAKLRETPAVVLGRFTRRLLEAHGVRRIEVTAEARFSEAIALLEHLAAEPVGT